MKKKVTRNKRENTLHREFVKVLLKAPIRDVKFFKNSISLTFFGHRISDKIRIKLEEHVAEWSRKRKEIFIDKKIAFSDKKKSFKALCVHELIEKFLTEKFTPKEFSVFKKTSKKISLALEMIIAESPEKAMNIFN